MAFDKRLADLGNCKTDKNSDNYMVSQMPVKQKEKKYEKKKISDESGSFIIQPDNGWLWKLK